MEDMGFMDALSRMINREVDKACKAIACGGSGEGETTGSCDAGCSVGVDELKRWADTLSRHGMMGKLRFIESPVMVDMKWVEERRTWRERLLTWPWQPWVVMKGHIEQVPMQKVFVVLGSMIIGHPEVMRRIRKELQNADCNLLQRG